jgi:hypothetical protein
MAEQASGPTQDPAPRDPAPRRGRSRPLLAAASLLPLLLVGGAVSLLADRLRRRIEGLWQDAGEDL